MKKIAFFVMVMLLATVIVEAQIFQSPNRGTGAQTQVQRQARIPRPHQTASADVARNYISKNERLRTLPIIRNNYVDTMPRQRTTADVPRRTPQGHRDINAHTGRVQWRPRQVLPVRPHRSQIISRPREY